MAVPDIAPTMQYALEHWKHVHGKLLDEFEAIDSGSSRPILSFRPCSKKEKLPPRYLVPTSGSTARRISPHVERVRRAQRQGAGELYTDPLMYQGNGDAMMGPRDDIEVLSELGRGS